jgi:hypothetical protein
VIERIKARLEQRRERKRYPLGRPRITLTRENGEFVLRRATDVTDAEVDAFLATTERHAKRFAERAT